MKKKIHDIRIMAALLMAGAAFTACSTDGDELITEQPQEQTPKTYTITVEATKDLDATRGLELSGNELNSVWEVGEKVMVVQPNASDEPTCIGELTAQTAGKYTTLTGTVDGTFDPSKMLTFYLHDTTFDFSGQDGTLATLGKSFTYGYCQKSTSEISVSGSTVTITGGLTFANAQAVVRFNLVDKATGDPINITSLTVHDARGKLIQKADQLDPSSSGLVRDDVTISLNSASNIVFASLSGVSSSDLTLIATDGTDTWTYSKTGVTFTPSGYYQVKTEMTKSVMTVGNFLNNDGSFTEMKLTGTVAVIAHMGAIANYCDKYLAIALEDAKNATPATCSWSECFYWVNNFASKHPVTIAGTTYNVSATGTADGYDKVEEDADRLKSTATATELRKGWRLPTVTDWKYILAGFAALNGLTLTDGTNTVSPTNPAGIYGTTSYYAGDSGAILRNAINTACGNTALKNTYWLGSEVKASVSSYAFSYKFYDSEGYFNPDGKGMSNYARAVFAY